MASKSVFKLPKGQNLGSVQNSSQSRKLQLEDSTILFDTTIDPENLEKIENETHKLNTCFDSGESFFAITECGFFPRSRKTIRKLFHQRPPLVR